MEGRMDNITEKSLEEESLSIEETMSHSLNALHMVVGKKDRADSDDDEDDNEEEDDEEDDDDESDNNVKKAENVKVNNAKKFDNVQVDNAKDDNEEDGESKDSEEEDSEEDSENEDSSDDSSEDDASEEDNSKDDVKNNVAENAAANNVAENASANNVVENGAENNVVENGAENNVVGNGAGVYSAWPETSMEEKVDEVRKKLIMTAQMERLNDYVDARLMECGWKEKIKNILRAEIRKNRNMTLENLFDCVKLKGQELVPDSLKAEMIDKIQEMYEAKVPNFTAYENVDQY